MSDKPFFNQNDPAQPSAAHADAILANHNLDRSSLDAIRGKIEELDKKYDIETANEIRGVVADRRQIELFVNSVFKNASKGYVQLRMFIDSDQGSERGGTYQYKTWAACDLDREIPDAKQRLIEAATHEASYAALSPEKVNFAPPVCTFIGKEKAGLADQCRGLVIVAECDERPVEARIRLEGWLGKPTMVVKTGGTWTPPRCHAEGGTDPETGEIQDRAHLYWRLMWPTRNPAEHHELHEARSLTAALVSSDPSAKPSVHPLRWPGGYHKKGEPRLCYIAELNDDAEVDLNVALQVLRRAAKENGIELPEEKPDIDIKTLNGLSRDYGTWDAMRDAQHIMDNYLGSFQGRHQGLHNTAVSLGMSALNHGYQITDAELYEILRDLHRTNPSSSPYSDKELAHLARVALQKAINNVGDDPSYKRNYTNSTYEQYQRDMAEEAREEAARLAAEQAARESNAVGDEEPDAPDDEPAEDEPSAKDGAPQSNAVGPLGPIHVGIDIPLKPPPRRWQLGVYWCRGFVSSTSSSGGSGKTSLMLARAIQVATGRQDLTGEHVFMVSRVLYICFEDDKDEIDRRMIALCRRHEINPADLGNFHYHVIQSGNVLAEYEQVKYGPSKMKEGGLVETLRQTIIQNNYGVVILDPFVNTHELEENDNKAMNFVKRILVKLASELQIVVDIPHHTPKGSREAGDADNWRGGGALRDGLRLCYTLTTMTKDEADKMGIDASERFRYIRSDSAKVNITRGGQTNWFELCSINLENADDTYQHGDNVQAVAAWEPPLNPVTVIETDNTVTKRILDNIANADPPFSFAKSSGKLTHVKCAFEQDFPNLNYKTMREILDNWQKAGIIKFQDLPNPNRHSKNDTYKAVIHMSREEYYPGK